MEACAVHEVWSVKGRQVNKIEVPHLHMDPYVQGLYQWSLEVENQVLKKIFWKSGRFKYSTWFNLTLRISYSSRVSDYTQEFKIPVQYTEIGLVGATYLNIYHVSEQSVFDCQ